MPVKYADGVSVGTWYCLEQHSGWRSLSSLLRDSVLGLLFKQVVGKYHHRIKGCLGQLRHSYLCRKHLVSVLWEIPGPCPSPHVCVPTCLPACLSISSLHQASSNCSCLLPLGTVLGKRLQGCWHHKKTLDKNLMWHKIKHWNDHGLEHHTSFETGGGGVSGSEKCWTWHVR